MLPLPKGLKLSTLEQRSEFYRNEFDIERLKRWLGARLKSTVFTAIIGRHTNIYPEKYKKIKNNTIVIDYIRSLEHLQKYLLQYLPESAYYDRGVYENLERCRKCRIAYRKCWDCKHFLGQELAFDIDPENVKCPYHGDYTKKMKYQRGLSFCLYEFNAVKKQTIKLYEKLAKNYSNLKITYSGRGFHIHVFDKDSYKLGKKERLKIAREIGKKYVIDEWVTAGEMRLIRLPYSLHGMVSRVCIPVRKAELLRFDYRTEKRCLPKFSG